jgi:hypothetical protein
MSGKESFISEIFFFDKIEQTLYHDQMENVSLIKDAQAFIEKFGKRTPSETVPEAPIRLSFRKKGVWPEKVYDFRVEFLTYVEVFWFTEKRLPTEKEVRNRFPKETFDWQKLIIDTADSLSNRGILPYEAPVGYIEPRFVAAVNLILAIQDGRTQAAKLKEVGVTSRQWQAYLRREPYRKFFEDRLNEIWTQDVKNDAKLALHSAIKAGDVSAIKHFHELENIYRPKHDANASLIQMLQVIIDIVAKFVEPAVLAKIANEIQRSPVIETTEHRNALHT